MFYNESGSAFYNESGSSPRFITYPLAVEDCSLLLAFHAPVHRASNQADSNCLVRGICAKPDKSFEAAAWVTIDGRSLLGDSGSMNYPLRIDLASVITQATGHLAGLNDLITWPCPSQPICLSCSCSAPTGCL